MNKPAAQVGASLLVAVWVIACVGLLGIQQLNSQYTQWSTATQTLASEMTELNRIKKELLQFASQQGLNSLSDPGRLPCPSLTPMGQPQVQCLHARMAYLPRLTHSATNYLNQAIAHTPSTQAGSKAWHYAVSPQLLQPNSLGWSQKVNWSLPALSVQSGENLLTNVAAVVARGLDLQDGVITFESPVTMVTVEELQTQISQSQLFQVNAILSTLPVGLAMDQLKPFVKESSGTASPSDASCRCRCTKTRCECNCTEPAWWVSDESCLRDTETCQTVKNWNSSGLPHYVRRATQDRSEHTTLCLSSFESPCVVNGPTWLLSQWPVSHYKPVAAQGRSCQPDQISECPLSSRTTPCECFYGWPLMNSQALSQLELVEQSSGWVARWH